MPEKREDEYFDLDEELSARQVFDIAKRMINDLIKHHREATKDYQKTIKMYRTLFYLQLIAFSVISVLRLLNI